MSVSVSNSSSCHNLRITFSFYVIYRHHRFHSQEFTTHANFFRNLSSSQSLTAYFAPRSNGNPPWCICSCIWSSWYIKYLLICTYFVLVVLIDVPLDLYVSSIHHPLCQFAYFINLLFLIFTGNIVNSLIYLAPM